MSDVHDWHLEAVRQLRAAGVPHLEDYVEAYVSANAADNEGRHSAAAAAYDRACEFARLLPDPRFVPYSEHLRLQFVLHEVRDFRRAPRLALAAVAEARRPKYANSPQRVCLHEDLISVYLESDPLGHETEIEASLAFMLREAPRDIECRICALNLRTEFECLRGNLAAANESADQTAIELESHSESTRDWHLANVAEHRCIAAWRQQDWSRLLSHSREGEHYSVLRQRNDRIRLFHYWSALALANRGELEAAEHLYQQGRRIQVAGPGPAGNDFAEVAYLIQTARHTEALQACDEALDRITPCGRFWHESRIRLMRCEILSHLGNVNELILEADRLRQIGRQLKRPETVEQALTAIISTTTDVGKLASYD